MLLCFEYCVGNTFTNILEKIWTQSDWPIQRSDRLSPEAVPFLRIKLKGFLQTKLRFFLMKMKIFTHILLLRLVLMKDKFYHRKQNPQFLGVCFRFLPIRITILWKALGRVTMKHACQYVWAIYFIVDTVILLLQGKN